MKAYELMLIINPSLDEEAREAVLEKTRSVITADGGVIDSDDVWGKRSMAYEIDGLMEGDYHVILFHGTTDSVAELDRVLRITDQVMRFMIVRRDDIKE
ncbi:MAG: 30S ribosomal protein S6 [Coriobacteriia bacterium]|nr:30S ribosomal protein S6 [Anaerosomatales bacterium]